MFRTQLSRVWMLSASALLTCNVARADDGLIRHLNNHFEGTIGAEHLSYSEINYSDPAFPKGADFDTESGAILASGLSASWQGKLWFVDRLRAELDGHLSTGGATYNGYEQDLQNNTLTPLQAVTDETFTDFQLKLGKGFALFGRGRDQLTPYGGFGLTAWHRDLGGAPGGYTEQYRHKLWKVGAQYQIELRKNLALSVDASYGRMFSARMNASILSPTFELGSTSIQNYTLGLRYLTSHESYVGIDTYWLHYGYDQSPAYQVSIAGQSFSVLEPTSRTTRDGVVLVFGYAYR